ncbi:MAG: ABC transporter ATP-binding protein/permease [Muribaculaceae bacterium]|nr:ABC transporter ATP-binding protein/permease [Alistipes senegalensis]MCM1474160.1 ABC transporter ATP-binding protein/permease [Muribaculaceae bacterium]
MLKIFKNLKKRDVCFMLICVGLVITQVWLDLTMPDYTQKLTESVSAGSIEMNEVLKNGGMMLLCAVGSMAAAMFCGFFASQVAANFAKTLREKLFGHILKFSNAEINKFSTPSLITRTTNDVVQLQMLIAMGMQMMIKAPVTAIWAIVKISDSSVEWTTAVFVCVAVIIVTISLLVGLAYPKFKQIQKLTDNLNDVTRENISGVRVVRAFNAEKYQEKKFDKVNDDITKNHLFTSRIMGLMMPVMMMAMNGLTLAIYWIGAYLINNAEITGRAEVIGNMTAFTQYALQIMGAFMMLVMIFIIMPRTMVSAKRINEVLETEPTIDYKSQEVKTTGHGKIEFKNVSFSYSDSGKPCLKNLNFEINEGETFAIIGATGTGKSTLVNLIPRYYDTTSGEVLIDGVNIKEYPEEQLEKMVSVAPQKATLFSGDIKSNITYGCKNEVSDSDERIAKALEVSKSDFVGGLADGIHSKVAQGGTNYSGGQKQRLSIARAVFKNSEIMIFDDTFSALDYKTDMLVRKSIREELSGTTVIIVAQRIGTIRNADKILVLHDGEIAGMGKHEELMENCSIYKEIALSQLSEEELAGKECV